MKIFAKRGKLLGIVLILLTISQFFYLKEFYATFQGTHRTYNLLTTPVGVFLTFLISTASLIGLWQGKKWGVYTWFGLYALTLIMLAPDLYKTYVPVIAKHDTPISIILIFFLAILTFTWPAILVAIAVKRKWEYFK